MRRCWRACSGLLVALVLATSAVAQDPKLEAPAPAASPAPAAAPAPEAAGEWVRPETVPGRADALVTRLEAMKATPAAREKLDEVQRGFETLDHELDELIARVDRELSGTPDLDRLEDLRRELTSSAEPLTGWHTTLDAESQRVSVALDEVAREVAIWSTTFEQAETIDADETVARRVGATLQLLGETTGALRAWRNRVLALDDRLLQRRTAVTNKLAGVQEAANVQRTSLFIPDRPPLWRTGYVDALREELPRVPESLSRFGAKAFDYLLSDPRPFLAQLVLGALLAFLAKGAAATARRRTAIAPELADATRVLERPIALATLLALLPTPWLQPLAPRRLIQIVALIALIAVARVVAHTSRETSRVVLASLFGLLLLDRLALAFEDLPSIAQTIFLIELGVAIAISIRVIRRGGLLDRGRTWVRRGAKVALVAFAVALVAEIEGWSKLSALLGRGGIVAALSAVYIWAAVLGVDALLVWTLNSPRWSRLLRGGRVAHRLIRWGGVGVWVYLVVTTLGRRDVVAQALRTVLDAGISIGALSVTLGGVLAFALTIAAAPFIARVINGVLEEGIYPRAHLSRGVPYALSTIVRYSVFTLAFIAALAAAGVQLGQLSILLGGLGVGVGLGLQDFVKNFAAGLTLLFERRVHVGDVVQIPSHQINGRVREIGMRAVVVRNWDGAEVVVPNMDLITGAVTNWTLSDQLRRVEIPVGVAYGTDPERVISLLVGVAKAQADVLKHPEPQATFQGFGASSLDFLLRAWTDREYDRTTPLRSDLALAIHAALRDAGIGIPFPQQDLHLVSVSPEVRSALGAKDPE
jgi:potassium efflux system protein